MYLCFGNSKQPTTAAVATDLAAAPFSYLPCSRCSGKTDGRICVAALKNPSSSHSISCMHLLTFFIDTYKTYIHICTRVNDFLFFSQKTSAHECVCEPAEPRLLRMRAN